MLDSLAKYSQRACVAVPASVVCLSACIIAGNVSSQYPGVRAGPAPAQAGNRKGLPLFLRRYRETLCRLDIRFAQGHFQRVAIAH
jgi:hypothetical protein